MASEPLWSDTRIDKVAIDALGAYGTFTFFDAKALMRKVREEYEAELAQHAKPDAQPWYPRASIVKMAQVYRGITGWDANYNLVWSWLNVLEATGDTAPVEVQPVQGDVWEPLPPGSHEYDGGSVIIDEDGFITRTYTMSLKDMVEGASGVPPMPFRLCRKRPAAEAGLPYAVEVQPPAQVREYVAMVMEGEYSMDELRFIIYNDTTAYDWLQAAPQADVWQPVEIGVYPLGDEVGNNYGDAIDVRGDFWLENSQRTLLTVSEKFGEGEASVYLPADMRLFRKRPAAEAGV